MRAWFGAFLASAALVAIAAPGDPIKVVYHMNEGVEFRVCEYTLTSRNIGRKQLIDEVKYVPSGVAEVARLQAQEGYAYLKP